ncbi:MAG: hypothetical protein JRH05_13040 [Deltaproteobacteria bacterium]|nr:hypothetical protein [Deltaproteobacteria bacterium]
MDFHALLKANLSALQEVDADLWRRLCTHAVHSSWELVNTRSGHYAAREELGGGMHRHSNSLIDPVSEAEAWCGHLERSPGALVILGFGLGYHVSFLVEKDGGLAHVLVIERSPDLFAMAMMCRDMRALLRNSAVRFLVDLPLADLEASLEQHCLVPFRYCRFLPAVQTDSAYYEETQDILESLRYRHVAPIRRKMGSEWDIDLLLEMLKGEKAGP